MPIDPDNLEDSLSHARHELRSPMNAIQGYASMLLEESQNADHPQYEPHIRKILSTTQHMLNLIGLLLLSGIVWRETRSYFSRHPLE